KCAISREKTAFARSVDMRADESNWMGGSQLTEAARFEGDFDYVILGAGTAGCVLANRLTADSNNRVLLLEAGGSDNYHWVHIPVGYLYCIGNPRTDWMMKTAAEPGLNGRSL